VAYEEAWRIAQAFMDSYYKQKGFTAQEEEREYQKTVTERRLDMAEESADLTAELQRRQIEMIESTEGRAVSTEKRAVAAEERAVDLFEVNIRYAEQIMKAQLEELQQGNKLTRKKIRAEGTSDELADQLIESRSFFSNVSPAVFNAVLSGDREQIINAFIQNSLDKSLIPSAEIIAYSLEQESPILFDYFRKIVMDAAVVGITPGPTVEEFRSRYGKLANIEDLLQIPEAVKRTRPPVLGAQTAVEQQVPGFTKGSRTQALEQYYSPGK